MPSSNIFDVSPMSRFFAIRPFTASAYAKIIHSRCVTIYKTDFRIFISLVVFFYRHFQSNAYRLRSPPPCPPRYHPIYYSHPTLACQPFIHRPCPQPRFPYPSTRNPSPRFRISHSSSKIWLSHALRRRQSRYTWRCF